MSSALFKGNLSLSALVVMREQALIMHENFGAHPGFAAMEQAADAAIARVERLERENRGLRHKLDEPGRQERAVREALRPHTGQVENVVPIARGVKRHPSGGAA